MAVIAFLGLSVGGIGAQNYPIHSAVPLTMHAVSPDGNPPSLPFANGVDFMLKSRNFAKVEDIGADPNDVPAPISRTGNETVTFNLTAKEVMAEVAPGKHNNYWTYNGQVPGPMMRVMVGDDVVINLTNDKRSLHEHNIDLHAVNGPGGGAKATAVQPGETKSFQFKALNPGLYIYHCATSNVGVHNTHGQFGLILVEPKEKLPAVDREFYVVQSELYTHGGVERKGLLLFDAKAMMDGNPSYVTFNGRVESSPRMKAKVGETVRVYVGNGGVNLISSFHVIGEIFDTVYPEAAIGSEPHQNIQTTAVLAGGATIVEFKLDVPGSYLLVDHALARMNKGAWAVLSVEGDEDPSVFKSQSPPASARSGH
ncbi:MAG: nitrite reductase, copper-containing [Kineosporiaceae bacterium]|nr:nitrite reductase, copper-containing [Aeromicrobium sp.]